MPAWPTQRRLLGTRVTRLDGVAKVTGAARYTYDVNWPQMAHAVVLYSPIGRARITRLEVDRARQMPGVRALLQQRGPGSEVRYHGEPILILAADTEAQARDALRAVVLELEPLPHIPNEEAALAEGAPELDRRGTVRPAEPEVRGDVEAALAGAAHVIEGTFRCGVVTHVCLETHGGAARWEGDQLTVWASTQAINGVRNQVAGALQLPETRVESIGEYMGGGFGSKFDAYEATLAARLAREAGRPVKLMLDREMEHTFAGCRQSTIATIKLACDATGRLVACDATTVGTAGLAGDAKVQLPFVYNVPNRRYRHTDVSINAGGARAMRAPGYPLRSFVMESAVDALAEQAGMDPVEFRKRNSGGNHPAQLDLGAARIGWSERRPTGSQTGRYRVGYGCALATWGGGGHGSNARLQIHADGSVEVWCSTQDLGTGTRTAIAIVAAETFGLQPEQITVHLGRGSYPPSGGSGGSTTIGGVSASTRTAAELAAVKLFEAIAPRLGVAPGDLELAPGVVRTRGGERREWPWARACGLLAPGSVTVEAEGDRRALTGSGAGGAQFARVTVDAETGIVTLDKIVAIQDCGLIVNLLATESQVIGAVIMGIGLALFEERLLDPLTGRMLNPNLEFYKIPGPSDIPPIEVIMQDRPERGVIGVGEPPAVPPAAAIANAVANAVGRRVTSLPLTPDKVLAALEGSV